MKKTSSIIAVSILGLMPLAAATHGGPRVHEINARHENEQNRIAKDFHDGELTSSEDKELEKREVHVKNLEKRDLYKDDGHLTKSDFGQLKRDENHVSRTIRRDKQ